MSRVCRKCHQVNDDYAHFCIKCGRVLKEEYSSELQALHKETVKAEQEHRPEKGGRKHRFQPATESQPRTWHAAVVLPLIMMLIFASVFAVYGYFCNTIIYIALGTVAAGIGYLYSKEKWSPEVAVMTGFILIVLLIVATRLW